jgi:hypothetical protein
MEKVKKSQVEYHLRCEAALPILKCLVNELENDVGCWRCYSGARVSLCQKWGKPKKNASCTNNLQMEAQKR